MDKHLEHQISDILAQLDQDTDIPTVHVILMDGPEEEDEQVIESTVEAPADQQIPEVHPFIPAMTPKPDHPSIFWLIGTVALLPTLVLISLLFLPALLPVVTVTIVPVTRMITTKAEITVTTGQITGSNQLAGRLLPSLTLNASKTVQTTGTKHQEASNAHGLVTFYNAALFSQTIPAGTLLTSTSGMQIVTDETAIISPGSLATNGQVTIRGHAVEPGPSGNIAAGDLYGPCCRINVFVTNGPFSGGQEATSYQVVSAQDIKQAEQALKASLEKSAETALISQVRTDETLITKPSCSSVVTSAHKVGSQAREVTVTVEYQCQGMTYNTAAMQTVMQQAITTQARAELGPGYARSEEIETNVTGETAVTPDQSVLSVQATSQWAYQFSAVKLEYMKEIIAGKSRDIALTLLLSVEGVAGVTFDTQQMNKLPVEPSRIDLRISFAF